MKTIDFEIRTSEVSASNKKLVGYAVRWNSLSEIIWDEFREQFAPGAFKDSLASGSDVRALYEHNYTQLLGRTKSGTLVLSEDDTGLRFELTPPNTQLGNDVLELVERGDISGMSFGFRALKEAWDIARLHTCALLPLPNCGRLPLPLCLLTLSLAWKSRTVRFSPNILNCAALAITAAAGLN
jgi:HK97 family phage prohead protease